MKMIVTSVSMSKSMAVHWRQHQKEILFLGQRCLRILMRTNYSQRGVARRYNRSSADRRVVTTRFSPAEYDALHYVAATLRVSVSSIITLMIAFWLKPARRSHPFAYATNYWLEEGIWCPFAGATEENIQFLKVRIYQSLPGANCALKVEKT